MGLREESPFTPGEAVPPELFVGRKEQIDEVISLIKKTKSGRQVNVFLTGDRGIGKSSIAGFLRNYATSSENMIGIHSLVGGTRTVDELVRTIFEEILKESRSYGFFEELKKFFRNNVEEAGLAGFSVKFSPSKDELEDLKRKFPEAISNLLKKLTGKSGIFIALDDLNGLAESEEFAKWYKSFVDTATTHYLPFPVLLMVVGYPEGKRKLFEKEPSLQRIFEPVHLDRLPDEDVKIFFKTAFSKVNVKIEEAQLNLMTKYSSGLPTMMHEIGEAVFLRDDDKSISEDDVRTGLMDAAVRVGQKYLEPRVYNAIRSEKYISILRKMVPEPSKKFTRKEVLDRLNENERKVLDNFLPLLMKLGVIEHDADGGQGAYTFINDIYPIYIWLESHLKKQKK